MGTANTAWKLTDLWNGTLFEFDMDGGWHPINENQSVELTGEIGNLPTLNLIYKIDLGLGRRNITLQGVDIADGDLWKLSSAIAKRQLMKLWVGEDWFYYVLGVEPRQIRDQSLPYQKSYLASFMAVDPHYYYADSANGGADGTKNQVGPTTVIGNPWVGKECAIPTKEVGSIFDKGTTTLEPIFWIVGGTNTSITKIIFRGKDGREVEYTPTTTITNTHVHVIMPFRNTLHEGFLVNDTTGFRLLNGISNAYITEPDGTPGDEMASTRGTWAMDAFNHGAGTDDSIVSVKNTYRFIEEEVSCILHRHGTTLIPKNRYYPKLVDDFHYVNAIVTGTVTDAKVFAQYCVRRV